MSIPSARRRAVPALALTGAVALAAGLSAVAPAAAPTERCGSASIDRAAIALGDTTSIDPGEVVLGVAGFSTTTEGDDVVFGRPVHGDTINGRGGNDVICGFGGNETIDGGDGDDVIDAHAGNDVVTGGSAADRIAGGEGDDTLDGGVGADTLDGGAGVDVAQYAASVGGIVADLGTGEVTGGAGTDALTGVEGIAGTAYDDELVGGPGDNILIGGDGADTLDGASGDDVEDGGPGEDSFAQSGEVANGADALRGGADVDQVDYSSRGNPVAATNDGVANDGETGEGDNIGTDVEAINLRPRLSSAAPSAPDLTPPAFSAFRTSNTLFSPNDDGRQDEFRVTSRLSEPAQWTLEIVHGTSALYTEAGQGTSLRAAWNGLTSDARNAASATYRWRVTAKDAAGNQSIRTGTVTVDRKRPVVRRLRVSRALLFLNRARASQIRFSVSEEASVRIRIRRGDALVRRFATEQLEESGPVALSWNGRTTRGRSVAAGRYRLVIEVSDLAGNVTIKRGTITVVR
jgi:hypothetical protein